MPGLITRGNWVNCEGCIAHPCSSVILDVQDCQEPTLGFHPGTPIIPEIRNSLKFESLPSPHVHGHSMIATVYIAWLVVWNMNFMTFHSVGNVIIPTDEVIFEPPHQPVAMSFGQNLLHIPFLWFDFHVSWFICLKSPWALRSFNTLYRRVITSEDFHDMRKNKSLWDLTCKRMQTNEKASQYISKYLKKSQRKLKISQTISENLEGLSDKKRNNHFGTPKNIKILQNISKNPKHAKTCKNMQIHALICKQNSGQRGYDCECCRKVICLRCFACVLSAACLWWTKKDVYYQQKLYNHDNTWKPYGQNEANEKNICC